MVNRPNRRCDQGSILVLTLVLVVVMSVIVIAMSQYVTVGNRTSGVASERTNTNADSANVMQWAIEQFAKKQLAPDVDCGAAPVHVPIDVSSNLQLNGSTTTLTCAQTNPINGEPVVHLIARSTGDQTRVVEATVEIPQYSHGARVADWRVDIPIAVPPYTTTTTTSSTTTTAPSLNTAPYAADISINVGLDDSAFTFSLQVTDAEGDPMTISNLSPSGPEITVSNAGGIDVSVAATSVGGAIAGASYAFTYTVDDDEPLTSNVGNVTVFVDATPTSTSTSTTSTTTTTLAPNASCTFVITSAQSGGSSGIGVLEVANSGGDFTGWQVQLTQKDPTKPWQFTWGPGVTAVVGNQYVDVAGAQTITQTSPFSESAQLAFAFPGQPKIVVNDTLACAVISPP